MGLPTLGYLAVAVYMWIGKGSWAVPPGAAIDVYVFVEIVQRFSGAVFAKCWSRL